MKRDRELEGRTQHATIASHKGLFSRPLFFVSMKAIYSFFIHAWSGILMSVPENKKNNI